MANTTDQAAPETPRVADSKEAIQFRIARRELAETSITVLAFLAIYVAFGIWTHGVFFSVAARLLDIHSSVPVLLLGLAAAGDSDGWAVRPLHSRNRDGSDLRRGRPDGQTAPGPSTS